MSIFQISEWLKRKKKKCLNVYFNDFYLFLAQCVTKKVWLYIYSGHSIIRNSGDWLKI